MALGSGLLAYPESADGAVASFKLQKGARIGQYRVLRTLGRGWEGEVYQVAEVPTEAVRALKLFRNDRLQSVRHLVHFAWYYEQLRWSGHTPIYHHYGQCFLDDDNGCWYLVFEFVPGQPLETAKPTEALFIRVAQAMARVHQLGYAIGDLSTLSNVVIRKSNGDPVFVDCDPGEPDCPNTDFGADCLIELPGVAKSMFGECLPPKVDSLLGQLYGKPRISKNTLGQVIKRLG